MDQMAKTRAGTLSVLRTSVNHTQTTTDVPVDVDERLAVFIDIAVGGRQQQESASERATKPRDRIGLT